MKFLKEAAENACMIVCIHVAGAIIGTFVVVVVSLFAAHYYVLGAIAIPVTIFLTGCVMASLRLIDDLIAQAQGYSK